MTQLESNRPKANEWCFQMLASECTLHFSTDTDHCRHSPCGSNGRCYDDADTYNCECNTGYTGQNCTESEFGAHYVNEEFESFLFRSSWPDYLCIKTQNCTFHLYSGVQCGDPGPGIEATRLTSNTVYYYSERANYSCNNSVATVTQGSLSLLCQDNGEWSGSPPVCGE